MFEIVLWGGTGLIAAALLFHWWRQDARERREAELFRRWRNATTWNRDTSARVVRISRIGQGVAWLDDGEGGIEVSLPDNLPPALDAGWYAHVTGWMTARRATRKGKTVKLEAESVREVFPPDTPELINRLSGRGDRPPGIFGRLLGLRGL